MFTVCVSLVFRSKYVQLTIICYLQYSISINTVEVDPHSDLLHIGIAIVKPKNREFGNRQPPKIPIFHLDQSSVIIANEFTINSPNSLKSFNCWRVYCREIDANNVAV